MLIQAIYIYDIIPMTLFTEVCCYCESQMTDNDLFWTLLDLLALENIYLLFWKYCNNCSGGRNDQTRLKRYLIKSSSFDQFYLVCNLTLT